MHASAGGRARGSRLLAHAASSAGSCERDDLGVGRAGLDQLVVRAEPTCAVVEDQDLVGVDDVDTRWATMITVDSRVIGPSAARSRASVARSSAENESSKR